VNSGWDNSGIITDLNGTENGIIARIYGIIMEINRIIGSKRVALRMLM